MMLSLLGDKDKLAGNIMEKVLGDGKSVDNGPKQFPEGCRSAAHELIKAVDSKDANAIIAAFIALSQETSNYEG